MLVSALGLTKTFRWIGTLEFGFAGEQDPATPDLGPSLLTGPAFRFELPIFNQGQDRIALGEAELRQAEDRLEGLAIDVRSETREIRGKLASLRETSRFYREELLPLRKRILGKMLAQYNAMQVSADQLFVARADELSAEQDYINTLRDYWITRAALERAVGGRLSQAMHNTSPGDNP
jgi:cobalt-zinc-cadmium efflux system outer membrane protein